jgi:hypothetical protein
MLENTPAEGDIQKLASKYPDKYIAALSQLARTAGFTDKTEQTHTFNLNVGRMSDSQLEDKARQLAQQLQLGGPVIDADFSELATEQPATEQK